MSQTTFLQSVGAVLTTGLKATVELHGLGDGQVKLIYTPEIGPTPENASEEVVQLRAAICKPMVVSGSPAEIEEAFAKRIADKAQAVMRGVSALDEISRLTATAVAKARGDGPQAQDQVPDGEPHDDDDEEHPADTDAVAPKPSPAVTQQSKNLSANDF